MKIGWVHLAVVLLMTLCPRAVQAQQVAQVRQTTSAPESVVVPAGVPLHIRVTRTAHLHTGAGVMGVLTEPIYVRDRLVLPIGSAVRGNVIEYAPVEHLLREQALLNGDVTPLHDPVVDFTSIHLAATNVEVPMDTRALIRTTQMVRFTSTKKTSLIRRGINAAKVSVHDTYDTFFGPDKKDRALRLLYGQLPYHPQRIWSGTEFVAEFNAPVTLELPPLPPVVESDSGSLSGKVVDARLAESLDSKTAKKGDVITALVTTPLFDQDHKLILPEGAELDGLVSTSKPARSFGRNGQLRFAIRGVKNPIQPPGQHKETVYGTLSGAEGNSGQNLSVDSEGNVKANPDKNRFVAPLLLAATAMAGADQDSGQAAGGGSPALGNMAVASNGFGLVARVAAITAGSRDLAIGFGAYAFAKSVYFRFLNRGHEVTFPKDTELEITFSTR
jgi:hypothetical protein